MCVSHKPFITITVQIMLCIDIACVKLPRMAMALIKQTL